MKGHYHGNCRDSTSRILNFYRSTPYASSSDVFWRVGFGEFKGYVMNLVNMQLGLLHALVIALEA